MSDPTNQASQLRLTRIIGLGLALLTLAVYWPVLRFDFVNFDDYGYVVRSPQINQGFTAEGLAWFPTAAHVGNWHPLTLLSHMLDCQLFGLNPSGHHATNLLLHTLNVVLVFLVLRALTGATWRSAAVAALFAIHPLRVESVAWVSERKGLLSAFFWLLTIWAYVRYTRENSRRHYALALVACALALMSKPMAVTLPCALLLLDFWPLERWKQNNASRSIRAWLPLLREKIPFFALTILASVMTVWAQNKGGAVMAAATLTPLQRIQNALVAYVGYLGEFFWPANLCVYYPHPFNWPAGIVVASTAVLVIITVLAVVRHRHQPMLALGWFWFLGTLVPAIGLIQVGSQSMADRYTYLPLLGIAIAVVWLAHEAFAKLPQSGKILGTALACALVPLTVATHRQLSYWQNTETLLTRALRINSSNNPVVHLALGDYYLERGDTAKAEPHFTASIQQNPGGSPARAGLGLVRQRQGRLAEAKSLYQEALRLSPRSADVLANLGLLLHGEHNDTEALRFLQEAIAANAAYAPAHQNLGFILAAQGKYAEAIPHYTNAIQLDPSLTDGHVNLGIALARTDRWPEAQRSFERALQLAPNHTDARNNLALAYLAQGHAAEAAPLLERSLAETPQEPILHFQLGLARAALRDTSAAIKHFETALPLAEKSNQPALANNIRKQLEQLRAAPNAKQ